MEKVNKVFVYGTLRQHETNHYLVKNANCVSRQCWTNGILFNTGNGYPALLTSQINRVYGEVYEVSDQQLERLDELEGYKGKGRDNLYERTTQVVHTDFETIKAYIYVYSSNNDTDFQKIKYGDWKCHQYLQQDELLYFAYGSCMDDERFKLAGVNHLFERVAGCGVAKHYSLVYTRKAHDGGRADLIESAEYVEGKVYHISREALTYLIEREGVKAQIYRPAFIDVTIDGKTNRNVLTFFVVDKEMEVAPPKHYWTEILRGAKSFVSESYYQKLVEDLYEKFGIKG